MLAQTMFGSHRVTAEGEAQDHVQRPSRTSSADAVEGLVLSYLNLRTGPPSLWISGNYESAFWKSLHL